MAQESEAVGMIWLPEMLDQALLTILLGTVFQRPQTASHFVHSLSLMIISQQDALYIRSPGSSCPLFLCR